MKTIALTVLVLLASASALAQQNVKLCVPTPGQTGVVGCQDVNTANPLPVTSSTTAGTVTLVPLDVATVTTGGAAVTALAAGHSTKGGVIQNPSTATVPLCINQMAVASTTPGGSNVCIAPGATFSLAATGGAVSVVSSDALHPFSGYGWN